MASCLDVCAKIVNDMTYNCDEKSTGGIVQEIKLINVCDVDITKFTISNSSSPCGHEITAFTGVPADLNAVKVQGIPSKRLLSAGFDFKDTDFGIYYTHMVDLFGQGMTKDTVCNLKAFSNGARVVAIIEQNNKGTNNESAFWVYGWQNGLSLADGSFKASENNGNTKFQLASKEPDLEPYPPFRLALTDYATTKAFFDAL